MTNIEIDNNYTLNAILLAIREDEQGVLKRTEAGVWVDRQKF